jgi:2-polyprenyl-6-methoxyphenol hydroxylase-like FAD-dependent oxidoreductase
MSQLLKGKKVAIVGGGPSGLTLGRLLQEAGVDVKVYERDTNRHVRQQGSTLDMHYHTGLKAITTAGLLPEFKKRYRKGADRSSLLDSKMNILIDDQVSSDEGFGSEAFRPEIDRGPLRDLLANSLNPDNLVWDSRFVNLSPDGTGWKIDFFNGKSTYADLVIGADGANSAIRKYVTNIRPIYSGSTSIEGTLLNAPVNAPKLWSMVKGGSLHALDNGKTIFFISKGDGSLTFLMGVTKPEGWLAKSGIDVTNKSSVENWFKEEYADWAAEWQELFASDQVTFVAREWYHFPPEQYWEAKPNLTIIGDAVHRVPPYAGEGANQALADALDLYEALCLSDSQTLKEAIASYEDKMFKRSSEITKVSVENTIGFHSKDNIQFLLKVYSAGSDAETPIDIN